MQRKSNFLWLLFLPVLFVLPSCGDDLLTESPTNFLSPVNFYRNAADAEIALNGVYAGQQRIQGYAGGDAGVALLWGVHGSDEIVVPPWTPIDRRSLFLFNLNPELTAFFNIYSRHYQEINRANTVIDRVGAMSEDQISEEAKASVIAQARVIRGSFYFNLVRIWNRVPLVLQERTNLEDLKFLQSEPEDIYAQIISDISVGVETLEEGSQTGRITKGAAQALLGKVYLQMAGWPLKQQDKYALAASQFQEVMESGQYELLDDFQQVFDFENELNRELVYVVEHDAPGETIDGTQQSNLGSFMGPGGALGDGGGWGTAWAAPTHEFAYDRGDQRRTVTVAYHNAPDVQDSTRGPNQFRPWKWQKPTGQAWGNDTPFDYPYIRYAEVLLGFAEAHAQANSAVTAEALDAINQVRTRARAGAGADVVPNYTTDLGLEAFMDAIVNERLLELAYEGHRKGDLVRWELLVETMLNFGDNSISAVWPGAPDVQDHETLWPIPQPVLDLNPDIVQNPGY
ncbi:MAG: RagB/SusD family nutrient uptake outer membrane protein [Bacteroidota bacterium]